MTGTDITGPQVTGMHPEMSHLTGSHQEVAVEVRKLASTVRFTSKAEACRRRQSCESKSCHVTSDDRRDPK